MKVRQEIDAQLREVGQNTSNNEKVTVLISKNFNLINLFLIFYFFKPNVSCREKKPGVSNRMGKPSFQSFKKPG